MKLKNGSLTVKMESYVQPVPTAWALIKKTFTQLFTWKHLLLQKLIFKYRFLIAGCDYKLYHGFCEVIFMNYRSIIMENCKINNFLAEYGLTLADVYEPDLGMQKEYHKLLCAILEAEEPSRTELLDYASEILRIS